MRGAAAAALIFALSAAPAAPAQPTAVRVDRFGATERVLVRLDGALVAALALPGDRALLALVRPAAESDGERRLLRLELAGPPRIATLAVGIGGWTKALAAIDLGRGPELVAAGLGRLAALGPLGAPDASRRLVEHPGFDLRSLDPGRLRVGVSTGFATAEVGALRLWAPDGAGGLALAAERVLPFEVERTSAGLRLAGVRVTALPAALDGAARFAVGPEPVGATRLRVLLLEARGGDWTEQVAWAASPGPERVEESWVVDVDGAAALVVRAQGGAELDLLEAQRWRLWPLGADRTRAGRPPALAFEADSKRWHESSVAVADIDRDGRDDLVVARPEGLSGSDLVVEVHRGLGGGRFELRPRRDDLDGAGRGWRLLDVHATGGAPALAVRYEERIELRVLSAQRQPLERVAALAAPLPEPATTKGGFDWLGAFAPAGEGRPTLVALAADERGAEHLVVVRGSP